MRFTLIYKGRIPSSGSNDQIVAIRTNPYFQAQLAALHAVTAKKFDTDNKLIVGGTKFTAVLPIGWVCSAEVVLLRATPTTSISGLADIDNTLKTLFDAICAPAGASAAPSTQCENACFVVALEDKQLSSIAVSSDHHWGAKSDEDIAFIRVTTQETPIDDVVALGGQSFKTIRRNVFS
jgi:hypothetical protein